MKSQDKNKGLFYFYLGAAFLLRLFLMPLTMHNDLIFIQYFPYFLSTQGVWDIYGHFGDHFLSRGFTYYPPLVYYIVAFFQWLFHWVDPFFSVFMLHAEPLFYWARERNTTTQAYLTPYTQNQIFQVLFWMKLPYLFADAACVWLVAKIGAGRSRETQLYWLWSPVLIFSTYVLGQYRIFSALALWCVLYLVFKNKRILAAIAFGVLCLMENYPLYLLAPSLLVLGDSWKERVRLLAFVLLPVAALLGPLAVSSHGQVFYSYFSPLIAKTMSQGIFSHYPRLAGAVGKLILGTVFLGALAVLLGKKKEEAFPDRYRLFIYVNATLLFVLYAVSTTSVHYFMWILPFYTALQAEGAPWNKKWAAALMVCLFLFNLDMRPLNLGLLMPLGPDHFLSYPSLHEWLTGFGVPWSPVVALSRLFFSLLCFYFAVNIYFWRIRPLLYNAGGSSKT